MSNPEPTTGTAMLSQSSGRMLVVFATGTPINSDGSDEKPKAVKYPSQRAVNKYRTPKIPKNNRK
jgi:hypothetical protein